MQALKQYTGRAHALKMGIWRVTRYSKSGEAARMV